MKSVFHWSIIKFRSSWIYLRGHLYRILFSKNSKIHFEICLNFYEKCQKYRIFMIFLYKMFIFGHLSLTTIFLYKNKDKSHFMSLVYLAKMINFSTWYYNIFIYLIFSCIFKKNVKNIWFLWFFFTKFIFNNLTLFTFYILGHISSSL